MNKPKISTDWMCGCAGCHMSLLDMDERISVSYTHLTLPTSDLV